MRRFVYADNHGNSLVLCPKDNQFTREEFFMSTSTPAQPWAALFEVYHQLSAERVPELASHYAQDCLFRDPFNQAHGREQLQALFLHMFTHTGDPRFTITHHLIGAEEAAVYWRFECILLGRNYSLEGMSQLRLNPQGLVQTHVDYWDGAHMLAALPWVGAWIRLLQRQMRIKYSSVAKPAP